VRGTATPGAILRDATSKSAVSFAGSYSFTNRPPISYGLPTNVKFVTWPQTGAILKKAPHPEGAKLLHSFMLSEEYQKGRWSVRQDLPAPAGAHKILERPNTDAPAFPKFMADRGRVERARFFYEQRIGPAQGLRPLIDDLSACCCTGNGVRCKERRCEASRYLSRADSRSSIADNRTLSDSSFLLSHVDPKQNTPTDEISGQQILKVCLKFRLKSKSKCA